MTPQHDHVDRGPEHQRQAVRLQAVGRSRDSAKDYSLDSANANPGGIWSDGTTMWVVDSGDDKLYAYHSIVP